ncbi:MAG: aspartate--tRNA ligase, partial [Ignavibacteria bacterium]
MAFTQRTVNCGVLRPEHAGNTVVLNGWVHKRRDFGSVTFLDIRDRYGITQAVVERETMPEVGEIAKELRAEFVVAVKGTVRMRENPNPNIPTGLIEVLADGLEIISRSEVPIFEINDENLAGEELRLKYRYLDLRRPNLQKNFITRNKLYQLTHRFFAENDFLEVETPILTKSTPEGARDYLVPSRVHNGMFYALPQSPQLYKQLLMVSGFDRYMQIVKCFRDEDLRADRQPEFTQIDVEMSFIEQDNIIALTEQFIRLTWKEILAMDIPESFPRMSFQEAMSRFGSDKPDLRFGLELKNITSIVSNTEFKVFNDALALKEGSIIALNAKGCGTFSRKQLDELTEYAKKYGAGGLAYLKWSAEGELQSPIAKFL